ncbi:MAG: DUF2442 domain-containing protein [Magnetococcales bacterium]|nr:DUF2442 domain-containing protein [Magnetococcales bacterium]
MLWITHARHVGEYRVHLRFNDGMEGVADLQETLFNDHRVIFQELRDPQLFQALRVAMDTLVWDNGLDLAPEFLRDLLVMQKGDQHPPTAGQRGHAYER